MIDFKQIELDCKKFIEDYSSFDLENIKRKKDLKNFQSKFLNHLDKLIQHYNNLDKCIINDNRENLKNYRNRVFTLIQINQQQTLDPLKSKLQNKENYRQIRLGFLSLILGIISLIIGMYSVYYSWNQSKDTITKDDLKAFKIELYNNIKRNNDSLILNLENKKAEIISELKQEIHIKDSVFNSRLLLITKMKRKKPVANKVYK